MSSTDNHPATNAAHSMAELLQLILTQPVYVQQGTITIACLVSAQYFTDVGGALERLGTDTCSGLQSSELGLANRARFRLTLNRTGDASGLTINATGLTFPATGSRSTITGSR